MAELMALGWGDDCLGILSAFSWAHLTGFQATGSRDHARSFVALDEIRIPHLGKLDRFWDQGFSMCNLSNILRSLERKSEAATWYQRARDVGAAHGFFSLESMACKGLGMAAMEEGHLLRNALVAAELNELDDPVYELDALDILIQALFHARLFDEAEPLVLRFREAAKAQSGKEGFCSAEFDSLLCSARLHEVLCLCCPRVRSSYHGSAIASSTAI